MLRLDDPDAHHDSGLLTWDQTVASVAGVAEFSRAASPGEVHHIVGVELLSVEQDPWERRFCQLAYDLPGGKVANWSLVMPTSRIHESGWCVRSPYDPNKYVSRFGYARRNRGHAGGVGQAVAVTAEATSDGPEFTLRVCGWTE